MRFSHLKLLYWLALFLVLGEVGLEVRASLRGFDTHLFGDAPGAPSDAEAVFGPTEGFPFRSPVLPDDASGVRIWFGSSSYAEDLFHPPEVVFPNQTARILTTLSEREVWALNRSEGGNTVEHNVAQLSEGAERWRPHVAVLYQLTNDIIGLSSGSFGGSSIAPAREPDGFDHLTATLGRLYEETTLFAQLSGNVTPRINQRRLLPDDLPPGADEEYRSRVERFVDTAVGLGITPVLVTLAHRPIPEGVITPAMRRSTLRWAPDISTEAYLSTLTSWNSIVRTVARERDVVLIDLEVSMQDRPDLFRDLTHFTAAGHARVAGILAERLAELLGGEV